jgi:hypothetical protein
MEKYIFVKNIVYVNVFEIASNLFLSDTVEIFELNKEGETYSKHPILNSDDLRRCLRYQNVFIKLTLA